jgi:iron complex outermembrane receptor protein
VGLAVGTAGAAAASLVCSDASLAADQAAGPSVDTTTSESMLEEVVVTGSHVRRVDVETASPVFVLDQSTITEAQPPTYLNCQISSEACGGDSNGKYDVKEIYAQVFAPILKDLPGVYALNLDAGVRYSDYSLFGNTTRGQFKVEYRPIKDLLVRGTYAPIYRAPTVADISNAPKNNSPTLNDLCNGYSGVNTAAYPFLTTACAGVPTNGTFSEPQNQVTGLLLSNTHLKPETGDVKTFGLVYDPSYVPGLSVSIDYWDYVVKDLLTQLDP